MNKELMEKLFSQSLIPADEHLVNTLPVPEELTAFDHAVKKVVENENKALNVWFDLDETLMCTDYICGTERFENELSGRSHKKHSGIKFHAMRPSAYLWLRNRFRTGLRYSFNPRKYPFLNNPIVWATLRPGVRGLLAGLKSSGGFIGLVTLSRRERVGYFKGKMPKLFSSFDKIICVEDSLELSRKNAFHANFNPCLKHPALLKAASDEVEFDFLVDDSEEVKQAYELAKEQERLITIRSKDPFGSRVEEILMRLFSLTDGIGEMENLLTKEKHVIIEDPYYLPYLVRTSILMEIYPTLRNKRTEDDGNE